MNNKILKIAIIVSVMPSYREGFYSRLFSNDFLSVKTFCQDKIPGMNLKTIQNKFPRNVKLLKYFSAKREKLSWQFIPWKKILAEYDVIFIEGNPRNLSHALFATYMKLTRKNMVLWTMAHSFRANMFTENVRLLWSRIFKFLFVYTDAEVDYLRRKGFADNNIVGMNNGLDQKKIDNAILKWPKSRLEEWRLSQNLENNILFLSCARLDPKNKLHQCIQALPAIINSFPNIIWCVIGGGTEEAELKSMTNRMGLSKHVRFVGELYHEEKLAPWFLSSEIFVHPAAIGLGIMHAFGYGLPVVTHGNAKLHGPEYSAFENAMTGLNFFKDDTQHLSATIIKLLNDNRRLTSMRSYVQKIAREKYNVDKMVERFIKIAKKAAFS